MLPLSWMEMAGGEEKKEKIETMDTLKELIQ